MWPGSVDERSLPVVPAFGRSQVQFTFAATRLDVADARLVPVGGVFPVRAIDQCIETDAPARTPLRWQWSAVTSGMFHKQLPPLGVEVKGILMTTNSEREL